MAQFAFENDTIVQLVKDEQTRFDAGVIAAESSLGVPRWREDAHLRHECMT